MLRLQSPVKQEKWLQLSCSVITSPPSACHTLTPYIRGANSSTHAGGGC